MVLVQTVGVFAVTGVLGTARRLHIRGTPGFRSERSQKCRCMRGTGTDFDVDRLKQSAALLVPILLQTQNYFLKGNHFFYLEPEYNPPQLQRKIQP